MFGRLIALVTGYTRESRKVLLHELIKSNQFKKIILFGHRHVDFKDNEYQEKTEQRQTDFDKIDDYPKAFHGADVHYCCLSTTRGKAGPEDFRRLDFDCTVGAARLAKQEGYKHFHLISSQDADLESLFLYPKVKDQTEIFLTQTSFEHLSIYRPAMLMVDRVESPSLESFAQKLIRHIVPHVISEWIRTSIEVLARTMYFNTFIKNRPSIEIFDNDAIFRLSEQQPFVRKE